MESLILKMFGSLFKVVSILLLAGLMAATLANLSQLGRESQKRGLVNILSINKQIVGE